MSELEGLHLGDALEVMGRLPDSYIDLVYVDPPFGTGQTQTMNRIRTGSGEARRGGFGGKTYEFEVISRASYPDTLPFVSYLEFLRKVLVEIHRLLKKNGSIYLHLDHHSVHYAKVMMDEIFGSQRFLNEIIWAYDYGGRHKDRWPQKHDSILWYSKSANWTFNPDAIDRIPYMAPSLVGPEKAARGKLPTDVWWMTIVPTNSRERTGYPTQKPISLLKRIVAASSNSGELVADFFCGSGTTLVAAQQLGRRYLGVDSSPLAIDTSTKRLVAPSVE